MIATRLLFRKAGVPLNNKDTSHFPFSLKKKKKKRNTLSVWIFYYKRLKLSSDRSCSFHIIFLKVCFLCFFYLKKKRVENERNCFLKKEDQYGLFRQGSSGPLDSWGTCPPFSAFAGPYSVCTHIFSSAFFFSFPLAKGGKPLTLFDLPWVLLNFRFFFFFPTFPSEAVCRRKKKQVKHTYNGGSGDPDTNVFD